MDSTFNKFTARATSTLSGIVFPVLGLLLVGLLANLSSREEVYANPEYGFSVLVLFGAAGCIGHLPASLSWRPCALDFACRVPLRVLPTVVAPGGVPGATGEWPVLVTLLLEPLVFLLSDLGDWV
jgi:hypothetical protein